MSELLTVQEVAELTRLHEMTIRRYIREGKLEAIRIGRRIRVPRQAVERLMERAQPEAGAPDTTLHEPAVAYNVLPRGRPPVSLAAVTDQMAQLTEDDLTQVAELVQRLNDQQEARLQLEKTERKALARKIVEESRRQAESLAGMPREQIAAEFHALVEEMRRQAIAMGQAIDGEWLGD